MTALGFRIRGLGFHGVSGVLVVRRFGCGMRRDFDLALPRNMEMLLGFEVRSNGLEAWVRAWRVKFGVFCFFERLFLSARV